jgi:dipeptidyl aminopeptidase/acylaminoacyl peptidase
VPGEPAPLAVARHDLEAYALRPGGESMLAVWNVDGRSRPDLRWIGEPTTDAPPVVIDLPQPVMPGWGLSADGRVLIAELTGPDAPRALYRLDLPPDNDVRDGRKSYERTTTAARLPAMPRVALPGLVHPELVRYPSSDGLELTGWLYRVPGRTGPGPTVVSFHGGPESQERPAFAQVAQALVVAGCAVFAPNIRGSSGSGLAFMSADDGPARESSFADIPATVNFLAGSGVADRDRVGAYGWSYGGYLTLIALVRWPELFRAGVSLAGMSDLRTFFADTEPWMAAASVTEYGDPTTDGDLLASLSPLPGFDRIASPVLLVHGEADTNVPVSESVRAHRRLRDLGSPTELMLLPGEGHTIVGSDNRTAVALTVVDWFTRWLTIRARP